MEGIRVAKLLRLKSSVFDALQVTSSQIVTTAQNLKEDYHPPLDLEYEILLVQTEYQDSMAHPVGGRLKLFWPTWDSHGASPHILNMLKTGLRVRHGSLIVMSTVSWYWPGSPILMTWSMSWYCLKVNNLYNMGTCLWFSTYFPLFFAKYDPFFNFFSQTWKKQKHYHLVSYLSFARVSQCTGLKI